MFILSAFSKAAKALVGLAELGLVAGALSGLKRKVTAPQNNNG